MLLDDDSITGVVEATRLDTIVPLSFVSRPGDIDRLADELATPGRPDVGVILKIEHRTAFENLPALLLCALALPSAAVMVPRGDLAVEVGDERLAEVQGEILLLCEAARVPVVCATQVLPPGVELSPRGSRRCRSSVPSRHTGRPRRCSRADTSGR